VRPAALWDAIYELAIGNAVGITAEGAQALVDSGIAAHEAKPDPHSQYVTFTEGDIRWGASSGLSPHTHEAAESGGLIDYLRTQWGIDHLAAANPHSQYLQTPAVQAMIDGAIAALKAEPNPFPVYLTQSEADLLYLPVGYTPPPTDLSDYYTKAQSDARYALLGASYTKVESDARYQPVGAYLTAVTGDARYLQLTGGAVSGVLTVQGRAVGLSAVGGNTLTWTSAGLYSDSPSKAAIDALTARVATLEAQVAALQGQMGAGATGHYHPMGTWRQTAKAVIPVTQAQEAVTA
jgi:hypothetical protein